MSFLTDVPESVSLITHLEQELKSKKMLFTKQHLQLNKIVGEGKHNRIGFSTSGKNHFHEMNGDVGMAGWK